MEILKIFRYYFTLFFLLFLGYSYSQNCDCEIAKNQELREKFKSACFTGNAKLFEEAVAPVEEDKSVYCKQQSLYWRATFSIYNSKTEECKKYIDKETKLLREFPCLENEALLHNVEINYFMHKAMKDSAVNACLKEVRIYEKLGNKANMATSFYNISVIFSDMEQFDKNHFYARKSLLLTPEIEDITKRANLLSNLANSYSRLYEYYDKKTYLDSALVIANDAIKLIKNTKNTEYIKFNALGVSEVYAFVNKDFEKSIKINLERKALLNPNFHVRDLYATYRLLSERYFANKQYNLANKYLDSSKIYADKLNEKVSYQWYKTKYEVLKELGKTKEALENYEHYNLLNDSIQQKQRFDKINDLETKYQSELKDSKILSLNQQKKIDALNIENKQAEINKLLTILILVVLMLVIAFFYFRQRSLKNNLKIMETEQRLNRARMDPHFFFNGMASLQNLAMQEKSTQTTLFISRFAKIMRQSLESTYEELTTIEEEVDFLKQYLEIQKLRYPSKFEYQFNIDGNLEINEVKLPSMIIQPFVENAIEHGFKNIDYKGKIEISFLDKNGQLQINIADNGKGVHLAQKEKTHKSRALQIIQDRLYLFNKQNKAKANYKMDESHSQGFKITINLPKIY